MAAGSVVLAFFILLQASLVVSSSPDQCPSCFLKCCPLYQVIEPTTGQCANKTIENHNNLTVIASDLVCPYKKRIATPYNYTASGLYLSTINQTLNNNEFCVELLNSTYEPFQCVACEEMFSEVLVQTITNHSTSDLQLQDGTIYPSRYWWYDGENSNIRVCDKEKRLPVRKCCPKNEVLSNTTGGICVESSVKNTVSFFKLLPDNPCPYGKKWLGSEQYDSSLFTESDALLFPKNVSTHPFSTDYCVEWVESLENFQTFQCLSCDSLFSEKVNGDDIHYFANGSLKVDDKMYNSSEWWNVSSTETFACACLNEVCILKCCKLNQVMNESSGTCTSSVANFSRFGSFKLIPRDPCRDGRYSLNYDTEDADNYTFLSNGYLFLPSDAEDSTLTNSEYCVDVLGTGDEFYPFPCFPEGAEEGSSTMYKLYPVGMLISEPFFLATMLVYAVIPELRNLHGLNLMCHVFSLFLGYLVLAIVQLGGDYLDENFCKTAAFIIYFSFLASFFWLNVMCLDIWWTFSGFRPMQGSVKEREHKKFIIYSLYCWGCPLIMLIVAMIMDLHPDVPDDYLKPMFGKSKCWFDQESATFWYFLGPIAVLIVCNIALFIFTAIKIMQLKNETKILTRKESKRHDDEESNRQRFNLYLKLFLVMGVNWIMEVVSWVAGGPEYLWYLTDIGNTLQGVLIFIIFVWKDRIRRLLMERFCPKRALSASTKSAVTSTRSITRTSPSRTATLNAKVAANGSQEEYRMKPLIETSTFESEVP